MADTHCPRWDMRKLSSDELMSLWNEVRFYSRAQALALCGGRKRPHYTEIPGTIAAYFWNVALTLDCAARGQHETAAGYAHAARLMLERIPSDVRERCGLPHPFDPGT